MRFWSSTSRRSMRPTIRLAACMSAVAIALAACGGDKSSTGPSGTVFNLKSVDNNAVPWQESDTGTFNNAHVTFTFGVSSGYIALQDNNKFEFSLSVIDKAVSSNQTDFPNYDDSETSKARGTYAINGSTISLTAPDTSDTGAITQKTISGAYDGSTITIATDETGQTVNLVFKK